MHFDPILITAALNVFIALLLGMLLGIERTLAHKTAGLRTYGLVAMGSSLFIVVTQLLASITPINADDLTRVIAGIITGLGFLCAGEIIRRGMQVTGLTTAAGLWVAAGIGIACGFGQYLVAAFATLLTLLTFTIFWFVEKSVTHIEEGQ